MSFDSMQEGVGASQVLAYLRKIVLLRPVTLISFEKTAPDESLIMEIKEAGINWTPLAFGPFGMRGGITRVIRMWLHIDRAKIIHARGNLAAIAALLRFPPKWIWDCRSLHADQRRALAENDKFDFSFIILRLSEYLLAKCATRIIVITNTVIPILVAKYKIDSKKIHMISTCVDTDKFGMKPNNNSPVVKILLAGTFSPAYDVLLMNRIISEIKKVRRVNVTVATAIGSTSSWQTIDFDTAVSVRHQEMPELVQEHDIGMSIWKNDLGVCLTSVASTKTAEFLACGRPVFINSLQGDFGGLFQQFNCGVVTDTSSSDDVVNYVRKMLDLLDDPSTANRCRAAAEEHFSLENGILELQSIYSSCD